MGTNQHEFLLIPFIKTSFVTSHCVSTLALQKMIYLSGTMQATLGWYSEVMSPEN